MIPVVLTYEIRTWVWIEMFWFWGHFFESINLVDELVSNFLTFDPHMKKKVYKWEIVKASRFLGRFTNDKPWLKGSKAGLWIWTLILYLLTKKNFNKSDF